jgi:cytochrome c biogenesis protein ResB
VALRVDDYLTSAVEGEAVDLVELPPGQMGNGIPACRVELTAGGETKELWLRRSERSDKPMMPAFRTVEIGGETFRLAFDYVRTPIPFSLQLADFEVGFDPGTEMASSYTSQVLLTDEQKNVAEKPVTITMNEPLTWRGYTFYQSNYIPMMNPATGQKTGQFASVFQVRYDPVWGVTYIGCLLVVLGTFVQFYMRSGVFTAAGGKKKTTPAVPQPAEL